MPKLNVFQKPLLLAVVVAQTLSLAPVAEAALVQALVPTAPANRLNEESAYALANADINMMQNKVKNKTIRLECCVDLILS